MATTGTYSFAPSAGDIMLNAFSMIQIRRFELTTGHLEDAYMQANLLMVDFSNRNPNCWALETQDIALVQGVPGYDLATRTVAVALARIETTPSGGNPNDRVLGPLSANDYASLPNKLQEGPPTSFFFSLLTPTPRVLVWPTPDGNGPYTLKLNTFRQMQDVALSGSLGVDTPYRFLDAFTTGLAARLAVLYPERLKDQPGKAEALEKAYLSRFNLAAQRDQESTPLYVRPVMGSYYS